MLSKFNLTSDEDSFGGFFDMKSRGEYGFMRKSDNPNLPGVRAFLEHLVGNK